MANCKECICEKVCRYNDGVNSYCKSNFVCPYFKDRSTIIESPCKFGDYVYETVLYKDKTLSHINIHKVVGLHIGNFPDLRGHKRQEYLVTHCEIMNFLSRVSLNKLGKTVFLTREAAEQALRERENNANK